jgi:hypothetical protein
VLADLIAEAEPAITAIAVRRGGQRTRGQVGGAARVIVVSEFGDDGTEGPVLGE